MAVWKRMMVDNLKMTILGVVIYVTREPRIDDPAWLLRAMVAAFIAQMAVSFLKKKKKEMRAEDRRAFIAAAAAARRRTAEPAAAAATNY